MFNTKLSKLLEIPNRLPDEPINDIHKNISAALQYTYEKYFFRLLNKLYEKTKSKNLCLSGGCAYNGTANGKIQSRTPFKNIWIPPAPSDAGSAIGAALNYWNHITNDRKENKTPFLGPSEKMYIVVYFDILFFFNDLIAFFVWLSLLYTKKAMGAYFISLFQFFL